MKNALLLVPSNINMQVDRKSYLDHCIRNAIRAGYMPYTPDLYEMFSETLRSEFVDRLLSIPEAVDTVLFFIDYGVDSYMFDVLANSIEKKISYHCVRLPDIELKQCLPSCLSILADVAAKTCIPMEILVTKTRKKEVVDARYVYFRRAKERTKATLAEIGAPVGKDHATVLFGLKTASNVREVINLYNKLYGQTEIETPPLEFCKVFLSNAGQKEGSILPHVKVEEREFFISEKKSIMPHMRKAGAYLSVGSY